MHTSIFIAGTRVDTSRGLVEGAALYRLAGVNLNQGFILLERNDDRDVPVAVSDFILIEGNERFSVSTGSYPRDDDPVMRKAIPLTMNEEQLPHDQWLHHAKLGFDRLSQFDKAFEQGDGVFLEIRDVPDAQILPGMRMVLQGNERFYTAPCGNVGFESRFEQELASLRRQYSAVEAIDEGSRTLVIARDVPLSRHWNRDRTSILVQVPQGYPLAAMDMFWVEPGLRLADGRVPKNADSIEMYAGLQWQRFSWHYPSGYRWNPSTDGLERHFRLIRSRFAMCE